MRFQKPGICLNRSLQGADGINENHMSVYESKPFLLSCGKYVPNWVPRVAQLHQLRLGVLAVRRKTLLRIWS